MFLSFGIKDAIDILLVALVLYYTYRFMRESRTLNIFVGILAFIVTWLFVSRVLEMRLLGAILDQFVGVGALAIIVLFQEEIRKFLYSLGEHNKLRKVVNWFTVRRDEKSVTPREAIMPIVMACINMARTKCGALIVIERTTPLDDITATGDTVDAQINQRLIENIFFKNSPLHDGAMVISHRRIKAAGCILPVSHDLDIPRELGLRHRAAMGISQASDAVAIVVSEETGRISVAIKGQFRLRLSAENLEALLTEEL
ncbi:MAG: diadenylate cyclase CdaA [Prevotella sp.]|nr:diadenylate cyclase CdaA [Prevotella sp.]MBQ6760614.1 diadenylate cyclase CdaA [Prevotella sp.]MBQ7451038.1 diadenylate cyclase CdaA [Prevotella sp.]MBQ8059018.1 diadenylate cyclase CdaA [Prevotella sp.]MBQ8115779.1 diadenylate cyclase CdaA [Prevotella sp.]